MNRLRLGGLCCALVLAVPAVAHATAPPLHRYQTGKRVKNLTWLLGGHKPSVYRIRAWRHPVTSVYDKRVAAAVKNMKWRLGYPRTAISGNVAGTGFIAYLKGRRRPFEYRLTAGKRAIARAKRAHDLKHPPLTAKVKLLVSNAGYLVAHASLVHYSQTTRMQIVRDRIHLPPLSRYIYEDCSSSVTGLYWLAGLADPNGLAFNGYGYTGTEASHGRIVWHLGESLGLLRAGDLVFYGGGFPHHHVAMYLGGGRVFSHGTDTGPFNLPVLYRADAVNAHRYFTP